MSLAIALWAMSIVTFLAYGLGRSRGRAEVIEGLGPLLLALEQLIEQAEASGAVDSEQVAALRKAATWN